LGILKRLRFLVIGDDVPGPGHVADRPAAARQGGAHLGKALHVLAWIVSRSQRLVRIPVEAGGNTKKGTKVAPREKRRNSGLGGVRPLTPRCQNQNLTLADLALVEARPGIAA